MATPGGFPVPVKATAQGPETVGRLVIESLGGPGWWPSQRETSPLREDHHSWSSSGTHPAVDEVWLEQQVVGFVKQVRQLMQDSRCSAMVTCPAGEMGAVHLDSCGDQAANSRLGSPLGLPCFPKSCQPFYSRLDAAICLDAPATCRRRRVCPSDAQ